MSEFDCGNRTDSCDNATICPCIDFINKETRSYSELLHSSLFREATKEERESVDDYIKSISKKLHTFTDEQLEEHDKQIRANMYAEIKELAEKRGAEKCKYGSCDDCERCCEVQALDWLLEQLKEQSNDNTN